MTHPNDMSAWDDIACQREHAHVSRRVTVDLSTPHGYDDLPAIPAHLARAFEMVVWDPKAHPVDGGPYCPAHDAVSETIVATGVWEPTETALTLAACSAHAGETVIDFGAQIGWFSLLAASCGLEVLAIDADRDNLELLRASADLNSWGQLVHTSAMRVSHLTPPLEISGRVALAKIDVEGAERDVVRVLWPAISEGRVAHLLIEVTPVFADYYGDLVADLVAEGYQAYVLPPKSTPPASIDPLPGDLTLRPLHGLSRAATRQLVGSWHQEMVWFSAPDARWS